MFKKTKKKLLAVMASVMLVGGLSIQPLSAQEADETAIDVTFTFLNAYILRGNDFSQGYQRSASSFPTLLYFQPDIYIQLQHGWWFDIWGSIQIGNKSPIGDNGAGDAESGQNGVDFYDELDYAFGYSGSSRIGDVSIGIAFYTYPNPLYTSQPSDLDLSFSYNAPGSPVSFYWLHSFLQTAGRNYFAIKFNYGWDVGNETEVGINAALGYYIYPNACVNDGTTNTDGTQVGGIAGGPDASIQSYTCGANQDSRAVQGFAHLDFGFSVSKNFFSWSFTGIYRYRPGIYGVGYNDDATDIVVNDQASYLNDVRANPEAPATQAVPKLLFLTTIGFNFGF